ncbi:hypothetical protein Xhom_01472 [Xenorhabdus hominickii]|uniref:Uncharacterized protein n=1 Tax=Xenorhabdus hominickii TaxID=351679 RepID=A0A2G0Q9V7_XENHO|nr:hypothetical protein Xhom_01472 [Xenorhabdus hominickii]
MKMKSHFIETKDELLSEHIKNRYDRSSNWLDILSEK